MKRLRKVKILATLGPASSSEEMIGKLHDAGADLFRINMSHSSHEMMRDLIAKIRAVEKKFGRPIGILADLQGPKLRVGKFKNGSEELKIGQTFTLDNTDEPGDNKRVFLPHPEILEAVQAGHRLLIDDGRLQLKAIETTKTSITCKVINGTKISDRKGVSLPDTTLSSGALTPKDRKDLDAILATDEVDWVALSFIQRPEDLAEVRKIARGRVGLMSKIEKPQALECIDEIIELSDALMVARGDLGVEMPIEAVPGIQKQLTRACRKAGKPVVVATQMLESMISAPVPTRAEVSDVATAVFEGADAISLAARQIAETLNLSVIVCYTSSGSTGLRAARERPQVPIIALSPVIQTARRLSVVWGLHCVVTEDATDHEDMVDRACRIAYREEFGKPGDRLIISAGVPLGPPGSTNMLRIAYIGSDGMSGH